MLIHLSSLTQASACLCVLALSVTAGEASPAASASTPPATAEHLIVKGQGYFPVAVRLADGRLAVVMRGGAPHLGVAGRLDIVFSADEGQTWTPPAVVVDGPLDDRNPAFGQATDGALVVGFWECGYYDAAGNWAPSTPNGKARTLGTRSTDGGKTWSAPSEIELQGLKYGSPYGRILTLPEGTLLMNVYGETTDRPHDGSFLFRSTDQGKTWTRYSVIAAGGFNETGLARLKDGTLVAALRHDRRTGGAGENVWIATSKDDGRTWSAPVSLTPDSVHPADLVAFADGRVGLVVGDRRNPFGIVAVVGDAQGRFDWGAHRVLVRNLTSGDCGYPSALLAKDGSVLATYYSVGSKTHADWGVHAAAIGWKP